MTAHVRPHPNVHGQSLGNYGQPFVFTVDSRLDFSCIDWLDVLVPAVDYRDSRNRRRFKLDRLL